MPPEGMATALAFNLLMFLLPLACAAAALVIARDQLYAYEYSDAGARAIAARVERLNGELIQVDFDRQRQWDNLVAMELNAGDVAAARGFLLSAPGILPRRSVQVLNRAAADGAGDAALEMAALQLLTPPTRQRYEAIVPLLSRSAAPEEREPQITSVGDPRDFELMASSILSEPESSALQFVLTGFALGLAGEVSPRMVEGAAVLLAASRRDDFPHALAAEVEMLFTAAAPVERFRMAALEGAGERSAASSFEVASAAFRGAVVREHATRARAVLDEIGQMSIETSPPAAVMLLTHASATSDLPRLRLVAQAAGDRAAAAAKRLPRDGRLLHAARGELSFNRDLMIWMAAAIAAFLGLLGIVAFKLYQSGRRVWSRMYDDDYSGELVEISSSNWRPL